MLATSKRILHRRKQPEVGEVRSRPPKERGTRMEVMGVLVEAINCQHGLRDVLEQMVPGVTL